MSTFSWLLAWRYLWGAQQEKGVATMMKICFISIFIGAFSLALVVSIMRGFEKTTHEKMQSIHAQIIIRAYGQELDMAKIGPVLECEFPEIYAYSPSNTQQVIVHSEADDDISNVAILKSINPHQEARVTVLEKKIVTALNTKTLEATITNNSVLIGRELAQDLEVKPGDTITLLFSPNETSRSKKIRLEDHAVTVGGIFSTGIDDVDSSMVFCSAPLLATLFPNSAGTTQINVRLKSNVNEKTIIKKLQQRLNLQVYSWKKMYTPLVAALKLEKYAMFFILALLTLVASMNIISLLFMQITQKKGDIAILKTMGSSDSTITNIFLLLGMGISFFAATVGLLAAFLVGLLLQRYPFITLPDVYYVTHLPITMEWHLFALVFITIMMLSFLSTWFPAQRIKKIHIANVLRFEA